MTQAALTPDLLLTAYAAGVFPMARSRHDPRLFWMDPDPRAIIPLDGLHLSRSLARTIRRDRLRPSLNRDFAGVIDGCADRDETWINRPIRDLCLALHRDGHAHSLEVWDGAALAGGIYGITLGGAFFGESMFSRRTAASKLALVWLVDRLRQTGFTLFDVQYLTPHLSRMGAVDIPRATYRARLADAVPRSRDLTAGTFPAPQLLLQRMTQTS